MATREPPPSGPAQPDPVEQELSILEREITDFVPLAFGRVRSALAGIRYDEPHRFLGALPGTAVPAEYTAARAELERWTLQAVSGEGYSAQARAAAGGNVCLPLSAAVSLSEIAALALYQLARLLWEVEQEREAVAEQAADLAALEPRGRLDTAAARELERLRARLRVLREVDTQLPAAPAAPEPDR